MALVYVCGAECRINATGAAAPSGFQRHHLAGGVVAVESSVVRSGARSWRFDAAATDPVLGLLLTSSTVAYFRGYFRVTTTTPSSDTVICRFSNTGVDRGALFITTGGALQMSLIRGTSTAQTFGGTFNANEWYGVEFQVDLRNNPWTVDWRIWRASTGWVTQTQATHAAAANSTAQADYGLPVAPSTGITSYWDDVVIGTGSTIDEHWSDSTAKGGEVKIYRPTADGTHSFSTSGDFKYENTTNFASSATDVYSHLDADDMTQTTEYISQNVTSSGVTKYCEVTFPNESVLSDVHAVQFVGVFRSAATTANEMNLRYSDDGTNWTNFLGNWGATGTDISETSNIYLRSTSGTTPPSGGSWTQSKVNGLRVQFGMSDDINPVPFVCGLAFEVAWLEASGATGTMAASTSGAYT